MEECRNLSKDGEKDEPEEMPVDAIQVLSERLITNVQKVIVGKTEVVELILISLLGKGHMLLEDAPGMGKTMLVRSLARSLGCSFKRIQFTPDLLPSDVLGVSIFNQKTQDFEFRPGPVMAQIVLADEINRTTPQTLASLLECMEESQLTVDGVTYQLPRPFFVLATQNPLDFEGTFPLPEAQLDRFLIKAKVGYPTLQEEKDILTRLEKKHPLDNVGPVIDVETLISAQEQLANIYVDDSLKDYVVRVVQSTRAHPDVALGASPRGSLALLKTSKIKAGLKGREYVIPDDVKSLAVPTLAHRLVLKPEARFKGRRGDDVIGEVLAQVPLN